MKRGLRARRFSAGSRALVVFAAMATQGWAQAPPSVVRVDTVRSELLQDRRLVTGELRAVRRSLVATRGKGLVLEMAVREGDRVESGAVLARLDARRLELELLVQQAEKQSARALLSEREADHLQKENDLRIIEDLSARNAANPKELADARVDRDVAAARVEAARAAIATLDARISLLASDVDDMCLKAPFAGVIVGRFAEEGSWLAEGAAVVELVSLDDLEVWLEIPQQFLTSVTDKAARVRVVVDAGGEAFELQDLRPVLDVQARGRTFQLVGPAPRGGEGLIPGLSVLAWIPAGTEQQYTTISNDAILRNDSGPFVYRVNEGAPGQPAQAMPVQIEVVFRTAERAAVRSHLLPDGAAVITEGKERLFPMAPVLPQGKEPGSAAR